MGKMKTKKMISKRFKVTRTGKVVHRAAGQDHFNARETGSVRRAKRTDRVMSTAFTRTIKNAIA